MKITLRGADVIRLEPTPGPLTIEAETAEMQYSPFHMLASGLASCTVSVLQSWATHAKIPVDDLTLEVRWQFADDPHRVSNMAVIFDWPSLPAARLAAARRVAELCTVHATLVHPPAIDVRSATDVPVVRFTVAGQSDSPSHGRGRAFTVVYDGDCTVCTRLARVLHEWDAGQLEVVASQQQGVMSRFPWIPARAYADALQVIAADGTTWQGAAAIEQLLNVLPKGRLIAWVFRIPFARTLADRLYRWFARNRYRLGCGAHCQSRPPDVMWAEAEREGTR